MSWNRADDGEQYEAARRLNAEAGRMWTVMWAPALRAYVAFYQGAAVVRWQSAPTAEGLVERLREAERLLGADTGRAWAPAPRRDGDGARTTGAHRRPSTAPLPPQAETPTQRPVPTPVPAPLPPTAEAPVAEAHAMWAPATEPVPPMTSPGRPSPAGDTGADGRTASAGAAGADVHPPRAGATAIDGRTAVGTRAAGRLPRALGAPDGTGSLPAHVVPEAERTDPGAFARGGVRTGDVPVRTGSRGLRHARLGGADDRAAVTARLRGPRTGTRAVVIPGEGPPPQVWGPLGAGGHARGGSAP
ncbi:hypothetical protein ACOQFV_27645 [Nocardiopsis changdeensis]|uniref:Uncharacterized protein n=1 Tax=Nocardiopsis changdeensis TaxID=2831969 RepID=A0ABX8BQN7_9ACTN|nr:MULTISPECIES: hypothetical protein [Nocardiopsis]QUX23038.1 hypothetical protein KGD84_01100 [Nocardiopsis changdeensis]QYX38983.1 hypothetical protein K1J57_10555 [Nocardiopsis sp. MT53]